MRETTLMFTLLLVGLLCGCGASPSRPHPPRQTSENDNTPTSEQPEAPVLNEPLPTPAPLRPIPHEGPLQADPAVYDCGSISEGALCEFDVRIQNTSQSPLIIGRIAQDFSPFARLGLVEDTTGFDRAMPYTMAPEERLRLLFWYRQDDQAEPLGGRILVEYDFDGRDFCLEIPIGVFP